MIKRLAVLAIFLGTTEAVNLRAYNQLIKDAGQTPPEVATDKKEEKKEETKEETKVEAAQAEADAKAASTAAVAKAASTAATAAAAAADPILTVNTVHNAPRVKREEVILDPKIKAANAAVRDAVQAAKDRVAAEPKVKAQRDKYNALLPDPLAPDQPLNPLITEFRRARTAADVPSHELGNPDVKSVAGPAETDQIGKSVYDSAMKGCDETPGPRNILSKKDPSFTPGGVPPIPWPAKPAEGGEAPAAPATENKEVVVIKQKNPDKTPTKQDVADAVAKADRDMKDALTPTGPNDPLNGPEMQLERVNKGVPTESAIAGPKEMAKAEVKVEVEAKKEAKRAAAEEGEIAAEKAKAAAEEEKAAAARKAEDAAKAEAEKAEKKAEEAKADAEAAKKHVEDVKKDTENAKADAAIEKKVALEDKEAAKDLSPQQAEAKTLNEKKEKEEEKADKAKEEKETKSKA